MSDLLAPTGGNITLHRLDVDRGEVRFAKDLTGDGEALTGTPVVTLWRRAGGGWEDITEEFGDTAPSISGESVVFWIRRSDTPPSYAHGEWAVRVKVATNTSRELHSTHPLLLRGGASSSAE